MTHRFVHRETVRWKDIDAAGVLNNAVYLTLLEEARFEYFRRLGLLRGDQFPFLLGESRVRFLRPVRADQTLDIEARVSRLGTKSFDMEYRVTHDGVDVAEADATLVWVDDLMRSARIPDAVRRRIATLEEIAPGA